MSGNRETALIVRAVSSDDELHLANDLMAKVHIPNYFVSIDWLRTIGDGYPGHRREHTRVAFLGNDLAGCLRINVETIRLGEARLRMGGFGWVTTDPRHRHKGVARLLMLDALQYMREQNYHVSMLFGIPNFYHRFGFATTLADFLTFLDTAEAVIPEPGAHRIRQIKPGDIRAIQKIHALNDDGAACTQLRTAAHITRMWERWKPARVLTDPRGKVLAYFVPKPEQDVLAIQEVGLTQPELCESVLRACGDIAAEAGLARLRFHLPPSHLFARHLLRYKSRHEMLLERNGGGMMAFVNLPEALESLIPEWESRIQASTLRNARCEVTLYIDRTAFRVRANRGLVDIARNQGQNKVRLSSVELMQLVTGYLYPDDVLYAKRRMLTGPARLFLTTIFPKRTPYYWPIDRF